jgi:hypothetical protein
MRRKARENKPGEQCPDQHNVSPNAFFLQSILQMGGVKRNTTYNECDYTPRVNFIQADQPVICLWVATAITKSMNYKMLVRAFQMLQKDYTVINSIARTRDEARASIARDRPAPRPNNYGNLAGC